MRNSNYSIGLQRITSVHTAYGAICMPIRKMLMHWHHSSPSQLCIYGDGPELVSGTIRTWPRPKWDRNVCLPRPRSWQFFARRDRDQTLVRLETVSRPRRRDRDETSRPRPQPWHRITYIGRCKQFQGTPLVTAV